MILPTLKKERELWKRGFSNVIGVDEVGRGAWAGPLMAGAALVKNIKIFSGATQSLRQEYKNNQLFKLVRDSKLLDWKRREMVGCELMSCDWLERGVGIVEVGEIDKIGVGEAGRLAMRRAVESLLTDKIQDTSSKIQINYKLQITNNKRISKSKFQISNYANSGMRAGDSSIFLLIDAVKLPGFENNSQSIIGGDAKIFSIACASIIAKVMRDRMMRELARAYPYWGFDRHKGYGTLFHRQMLERYGVSGVHRKSFRPIKALIA